LAAIPEWAVPALAQGESDAVFTDYPKTFNPNNPNSTTKLLDIRKIDGLITPSDQFFSIQHHNQPEIDGAAHRVRFTGMVKKDADLSLADLKAMKPTDIVVGYECSGNSSRGMQALSSCGKFTGVRLSDVLKHVGVLPRAREVVFFGADRGQMEVVFRQQTFKLEQQFGRSMTLENAMRPEPILAWALNGEPLVRRSGFPVRLIMPGWYGVANVKWLSEVHLQEDRYLGNYQARWYRSLKGVGGTGEDADPATQWVETEITRLQLKSVIARVRKTGSSHQIIGFVLNDGTPLKSVEVKIDDGPWQPATLDPKNTRYSWKLFGFKWDGATPGEHTIVSRVTDAEGTVQPVADELKRKKTFLQDNAQFPRKILIS
ncbi:MAG TPA: molybdopterin-dependent oxidoreductase, partial [Bryobacteraceae bacterium]|nr:molybdopterin-dependent oxidoreductase [Bryobacteraceae bacterium]